MSGGRGDVLLRMRPNTVLLGDSRSALPANRKQQVCSVSAKAARSRAPRHVISSGSGVGEERVVTCF